MGKGRVLLVDDNEANREMVAYVLRKDGHEVIEAVDGKMGMVRFTTLKLLGKTPHVVITDVYMPNVSGLAFAAAVRAAGTRSQVLIVTACGSAEVERCAKELDTLVMSKPLDIELLRKTVARWTGADGRSPSLPS